MCRRQGNFDTAIGMIPTNNYAPAKSLYKLLESPNKNIPFNTRLMKALSLCKDVTLKWKASLSERVCSFLFKDVSTGKISEKCCQHRHYGSNLSSAVYQACIMKIMAGLISYLRYECSQYVTVRLRIACAWYRFIFHTNTRQSVRSNLD
jgi:hypothetical protein